MFVRYVVTFMTLLREILQMASQKTPHSKDCLAIGIARFAAPPRISFRQSSLRQSFRVSQNRVRPNWGKTQWMYMRALKLNS
jgi:hypothetical protein